MKDELFGDIEYNYSWIGTCSWTIFDETIVTELAVSCYEGEEIENYQRAAFAEFESQKISIGLWAEQAIFDYYQEILPEYRERFGQFADEWAPAITTVAELARLVKPTGVFLQRSYDKPPRRIIGLLFDCTWDTSLGLAVKITDGHITDVGTQDIVL